jgi:peptidoglycan hydrolase-like protein with peptidoglycan-binding domain
MASGRAVRLPALFAIGLAAVAGLASSFATGPAFGQAAILDVITKIIQEQHALKERRREETVAVKRMQFGLKVLGYYDGPIDGDFGDRTAEALTAYRRSVGRSASGLLSVEEIEGIENRANEQLANEPQPELPGQSSKMLASGTFIRADTPRRLDAKLSHDTWIIIASRPTPEEAKEVAEQYMQWFPSTTVIHSSNGVFAILIGWLNKAQGGSLKDILKAQNLIPSDSFLSSGQKLEPPIWSPDGDKIHSRTDLLRYSLLRIAPDLMRQLPKSSGISAFQDRVSGFSNPRSDYLSLRTGGSTSSKEIRQLPEGTLLSILRSNDGWRQVKLLNGMSGWVSARYVSPANEGTTSPSVVAEGPANEGTTSPPAPVPDTSSQNAPVDIPEPPANRNRRIRVIQGAANFLEDLTVYLKLHTETPNIVFVAEEVQKLQKAVGDQDIPTIEASTEILKHRMEAVPGFAEFMKAQEDKHVRDEAIARGEATGLAQKNRQCLQKQIAENVTSPGTPALTTLLKEYENALRSPEPEILTPLNDRFTKLISEQGLTEVCNAMREPPKPEPAPPKPKIIKTDRNRPLLEGELTDWVLLWNASRRGPHVAKNIRGDIVFEGQQADVCVLHPAKIETATIEDILREYKVDTVRLDPSPCAETKLQAEDVLIANRGELLKQPVSYLAPLLGLVENGTFEVLKTLSSEEFEKFDKFCELKATEIENKIKTGADGYGLIKIDNGSAKICVTTAEQEDAQRALLNDQRKILLRCFNAAPEIQSKTVGDAFIDAERGRCGAIYAQRLDLANTIQSFQRDNVRFSVLPVWFDAETIKERADEIGREKERLDQQALIWKKQKDADDAMRKQREADKVKHENELRAQYRSMARAKAEEIENAIKLLVAGKDSWAKSEFSAVSDWYRSRADDGWEVFAVDFANDHDEVDDYGTADWDGRPLESVFTNIVIWTKNRIRGKKESSCWKLGLIFDAEYQMYREPFAMKCENASDALRTWKQKWGFRSQWIVQ